MIAHSDLGKNDNLAKNRDKANLSEHATNEKKNLIESSLNSS